MDPKVAGKILDRIAELSQGNEQRTMEYLSKTQTGADRQRKYAEKRQSEGKKQVYLWLDNDNADALKREYPGIRGGINWQAIIKVALAHVEGKDRPKE
ncbi:hypothetical protein MishRS11D_45620 (plasmid) [Methylomagnum ishizawai]|nr:hypothetical protein MishRS11D_45620 [Methylomagnum ishizawai]